MKVRLYGVGLNVEDKADDYLEYIVSFIYGNDEFMQLLGGLIGQLEQQGEQPEMLDKVKELNREILRFTMKRNLQNS